jgi:hypothetical protein
MIDVAQDNMELDITRARKILGWKPRHSLIETLPKMVSGLRADPFTWYRENDLELPLWLRELMPPVPEEDKAKLTTEDSHELMRLAQEVRDEIAASARMSPPSSTPLKQEEKHHEMMDMRMGDSEAD